MNQIYLKFWTYEKSLKERNVTITKDNHYVIRFWLENHLKLLRKRMKRLKDEGIINSYAYPKTKNRDAIEYVRSLALARNSVLRAIKSLNDYNRKP